MHVSLDELNGQRDMKARPVPAARSIEHFSATRVGDDVVLYDDSTMVYHTMNASAFAVWQLCDGVSALPDICRALSTSRTPLPIEAVELAVAELGEAGLLQTEPGRFDALINRRRVVKMTAVGLLGAAVIPAVSSITAPSALASHSCGGPGGVSQGEHCVCSRECNSSCCCNAGVTLCQSISNCLQISGGFCLQA
jgi:hypothetical protein